MADTPLSRSISRSGTPALARSSPSRLSIPPILRQTPSLSNLHIHSHNTPPFEPEPNQIVAPLTSADHTTLNSSASSVIDMEPVEGYLIQDIDADVEHTDAEDNTSMSKLTANVQGEETKNTLRDQLRSLSQKVTHSGRTFRGVGQLETSELGNSARCGSGSSSTGCKSARYRRAYSS